MIRLTNAYTDKPIWINPDHVIDIGEGICEGEKATYITTICDVDADGVPMNVTESPSEVARKVLEWRLAMDDYLQGTAIVRKQAKEKLFELAGLEESGDE